MELADTRRARAGLRLALAPIGDEVGRESEWHRTPGPNALSRRSCAQASDRTRREGMETTLAETEIIDSLRHSERVLDGNEATDRYVEHAKNVRAFDALLRARGAPTKASYREAGLSYLLARKALWLCELLETHERDHPGLGTKGPSILLFAREAERRLEREGRGGEVQAVLRELEAGAPRDAVRKKYLPAEQSPASELMAALRKGRVEPARHAFLRLDAVERAEIVRFSHALARLIDANVALVETSAGTEDAEAQSIDAPDSITRAVSEMLETAGW